MRSVGLNDFTLETGEKITISDKYFGAIKDGVKDQAFSWLELNGHDDIIKNDINISYGRGEEQDASELMLELQQRKIPYKNKKYVHFQTLRAFIREQSKVVQPD